MNVARPHDLEIGDRLSFEDQGLVGVDGQELLVEAVSTYVFYGDFEYAEFTLVDNYGSKFFLSIEQEGNEEYLTLSKELRMDEVYTLFNQNDFDAAVQKNGSARLKVKSIPATLEGWTAKTYKKDQSFQKAKFSKSDFRKDSITEWDDLEYHLFLDNTEEMAIEIEDYGAGEVEVSLTVYPDFEDIKSMSR